MHHIHLLRAWRAHIHYKTPPRPFLTLFNYISMQVYGTNNYYCNIWIHTNKYITTIEWTSYYFRCLKVTPNVRVKVLVVADILQS